MLRRVADITVALWVMSAVIAAVTLGLCLGMAESLAPHGSSPTHQA
jgi:hypothetical protein